MNTIPFWIPCSVIQAAGLTGSKKSHDQDDDYHTSRPISTLKDPSSFGPPPKRVDSEFGAAPTLEAPSQKGPLSPAEYRAREDERIRLEKEQEKLDREEQRRLRAEKRAEQEATGPQVPYRNDNTGLSTTQFTPPVARRVADDGSIVIRPTAASMSSPKRSLPPRLPDRPGNNLRIGAVPPPPPSRSKVPEPPLYRGTSSQVSLEQSPISSNRSPPLPSRSSTGSSSKGVTGASESNPQLNELQSRFARMKTASPASSLASSSDAQGSQVATGLKSADRWNPKHAQRDDTDEEMGSPIDMRDHTTLPTKKPPPPVPKKRTNLLAASGNGPPPLPLSTKPK